MEHLRKFDTFFHHSASETKHGDKPSFTGHRAEPRADKVTSGHGQSETCRFRRDLRVNYSKLQRGKSFTFLVLLSTLCYSSPKIDLEI